MDFLHQFLDFFLHLDKHLGDWIQSYGTATYLILFAIIFCETGFVVTPFLPGDSLLFAVGAFSAKGSFNIFLRLFPADRGRASRRQRELLDWTDSGAEVFRAFREEKVPGSDPRVLRETRNLGPHHRPIRSHHPNLRAFCGGSGQNDLFQVFQPQPDRGLSWTTLFLGTGYFFGNMEMIQKNFHYAILGIIAVSLIPIALEVLKGFSSVKKKK